MVFYPKDPITFSGDWGVQSPPQQGISVPLPFSVSVTGSLGLRIRTLQWSYGPLLIIGDGAHLVKFELKSSHRDGFSS